MYLQDAINEMNLALARYSNGVDRTRERAHACHIEHINNKLFGSVRAYYPQGRNPELSEEIVGGPSLEFDGCWFRTNLFINTLVVKFSIDSRIPPRRLFDAPNPEKIDQGIAADAFDRVVKIEICHQRLSGDLMHHEFNANTFEEIATIIANNSTINRRMIIETLKKAEIHEIDIVKLFSDTNPLIAPLLISLFKVMVAFMSADDDDNVISNRECDDDAPHELRFIVMDPSLKRDI